jgi:hypothetical protein
MNKKIDHSVREHLQILCYEVVLGEIIDQETRDKAKKVAEDYLSNNGYKIELVKCDEENNPPDLVDSNCMKIEVFEETVPGSSIRIIHTIML